MHVGSFLLTGLTPIFGKYELLSQCAWWIRLLFLTVFALTMVPLILTAWALVAYGERGPDRRLSCTERLGIEGFEGNSDFYGLGVRLGLYLQWLSSLIANPFLHGERRSMAGAYLASSLALTIALFILVLRPECVFTAEIMVMLNIIWGGTFQVMSPSIAEFTHRKDFVMDGIQVALMLVNGSVISLSAWFWVRMASVGETDFVATPGGTSYFLFSHVRGGDLGTASRFMAFLSIWSFSTPVLAIPIYAVHKAGLVTLASVLALLTVQGFSRMAGLVYAWIFGAILGVVPPYIAYFTHTVDKWLAFRKDMNLGNW
ncbi:hypothetical protein EDD37DRAFT_114260 [Exophiala viscosa]|uniref:uncharacterized protein n=1 Tax=Exophiala viscosa TaxID=2486360 RepID=UPI00218F5770|nr:hypothetical protein EDD37DRAFT_114260 [Exophiala viscosa]